MNLSVPVPSSLLWIPLLVFLKKIFGIHSVITKWGLRLTAKKLDELIYLLGEINRELDHFSIHEEVGRLKILIRFLLKFKELVYKNQTRQNLMTDIFMRKFVYVFDLTTDIALKLEAIEHLDTRRTSLKDFQFSSIVLSSSIPLQSPFSRETIYED